MTAVFSAWLVEGNYSMSFDYSAPAELFMPKRKVRRGGPISYRRFSTAAEAIRFAVESLPAMRNLGTWMQVGEQHLDKSATLTLAAYFGHAAGPRWPGFKTGLC